MNQRTLLLAMSLTLAACATAQPMGNKNHDGLCPDEDGKCNVTIVATGCTPDKIAAFPNRLGIDLTKRNVRIHWTLANSPGYTFKKTQDGIEIKANDGEFEEPEWVDKKNYRLKDKNNGAKTYDYKIRIFDANGNECIKDPSIVNGASN